MNEQDYEYEDFIIDPPHILESLNWNMRLKALKHKTYPETFGVVNEDINDKFRIDHCNIPFLQPETATTEMMIQYWTKINHPEVVEAMKDYEMVDVEVTW